MGLWTDSAGDGGWGRSLAGRGQRGDDHDRHHPGPDVGADHGADLADQDLAVGQVRAQPLPQVLGQHAGAVGVREVRHRQRRPAGRRRAATASSSSRLSARADVAPSPRVRSGRPRSRSSGLTASADRAARPRHRSGRRGGGTPACRRRTTTWCASARAQRGPGRLLGGPAGVEHVRRGEHGVPGRHAELPGVDGATGSEASRAASCADSKVPLISPDRCTDSDLVGARLAAARS